MLFELRSNQYWLWAILDVFITVYPKNIRYQSIYISVYNPWGSTAI